jgi:hypothetical protein
MFQGHMLTIEAKFGNLLRRNLERVSAIQWMLS